MSKPRTEAVTVVVPLSESTGWVRDEFPDEVAAIGAEAIEAAGLEWRSETEERLSKIVRLLESIEYHVRTRR